MTRWLGNSSSWRRNNRRGMRLISRRQRSRPQRPPPWSRPRPPPPRASSSISRMPGWSPAPGASVAWPSMWWQGGTKKIWHFCPSVGRAGKTKTSWWLISARGRSRCRLSHPAASRGAPSSTGSWPKCRGCRPSSSTCGLGPCPAPRSRRRRQRSSRLKTCHASLTGRRPRRCGGASTTTASRRGRSRPPPSSCTCRGRGLGQGLRRRTAGQRRQWRRRWRPQLRQRRRRPRLRQRRRLPSALTRPARWWRPRS
mmetsp:Transcript_7807/g.26886  ORF Transcript_7807/g.26886 Transcript_7807/m.26886 type:complete len:254 (-) Transcript_7807:310-1071(-)